MSILLWLPIAVVVVLAVVSGRRIIAKNDRVSTGWVDAWLKTVVIVIGVVLLTVIIPDKVVRSGPVANKSRFIQELVGVGLWLAGLTIVLGALWYAHRESRI